MRVSNEPPLGGVSALLARVLRVPPRPAPPIGSPGSLRIFRAAPSWVKYRMVGWFIARGFTLMLLGPISLVIAGSVVAGSEDLPGWAAVLLLALATLPLLLWLCLAGLSWLTIRIDREFRWYMVTDRSLRIREGIWFVREMTLTFANIQNVSVSQGPLQRTFGIADLVVQTAGGGGGAPEGAQGAAMHIGHFRGIANASEVRDFVIGRMRAASGAGLGDDDAPAPDDAQRPSTSDADVLAALREVAAEAAALRHVA